MIGIREWRRPREFPKGALKMVSSGTMYALSSLFIDNSTHMHCAAREWLRSTPWPNSSLSSFSTPSSAIRDKTLTMSIMISTKSRNSNWIPVCLKELNADKEAWEAPAITVACEETA